MNNQEGRYPKLNINYPLSDELNNAIEVFMHHINYEGGGAEDCYRCEIEFWLKDSYEKLPKEIYETLKDYYVHGGIYDEYGRPY